jgi:hypothetical protein
MSGAIQRENRELADLMKTYFYERNEPNVSWFHAMTAYMTLLGLRGFWPMTVADDTPLYKDYGTFGLDLSAVSEAGEPLLGLHNLAPYVAFDGDFTQHLFRADHADIDIIGDEAFIAPAYRGLTVGLWAWFDALNDEEGLISKWATSQQAYRLLKPGDNKLDFEISSTGANTFTVSTAATIAIDKWYYIVGRFDPSTEIAIFVGEDNSLVKTTNVTSIPATLHNSTDSLKFGLTNASDHHVGRQSFDFLCCAALPDYVIGQLYYHSKAMYNQVP